jgi:hypothetical protein
MVAGTSTGAIIAAGLSLGISARGLLALYRNLAVQAFEKLPWWKVVAHLGNHRYSNEFIARTLTEVGADLPINSLDVDVLITAKNLASSRTDFFVKDGRGNANQWGTMSLQDAVLASIAAPTYFPVHSAMVLGREHTWVDGGVGVAGNPCYHAAVEALHYSSGKYLPGEVRLLSFGTGRTPHAIDGKRAHALEWGLWTIDELLEDTADWLTYITRLEYATSGRIDFRRYQLDLAPSVMVALGVSVPSGVDVESIGMDATWAVPILEEIGRAFARRIDFDDPAGLDLAAS